MGSKLHFDILAEYDTTLFNRLATGMRYQNLSPAEDDMCFYLNRYFNFSPDVPIEQDCTTTYEWGYEDVTPEVLLTGLTYWELNCYTKEFGIDPYVIFSSRPVVR